MTNSPENADFKEAFEYFDLDKDGKITFTELKSVLEYLGIKSSEEDVAKMIEMSDLDGNGAIEYDEFIKMMSHSEMLQATGRLLTSREDLEIWEAFRVFDRNGDCFIDAEEIKDTMHLLGVVVSDEDVQAMICEADADNDGFINFQEFKKMMSMMRSKPCSSSTNSHSASSSS